MRSITELVPIILSEPTPENLIVLQGALLSCEQQSEYVEQALLVAGRFYSYLCELRSKLSARQYAELASFLDIGAVGSVALENLVAGEGPELWKRFVLGGLGESLMVAASRQYIKAWQVETGLVHSCAAWCLGESLWHASCAMQPDQPADKRWKVIQDLLAPTHDPDVLPQDKAVLLSRVFQLLLVTYLASLPAT